MNTAKSESNFVKRALSGHAAIGVMIGALIYLIAITGVMIVVHERWQRWEQPGIAETSALTPAAAQASMGHALAREGDAPKTAHLFIRMPTDDLPRAVVTTDNKAWYVDGAGRVAGREAHSWTEFVMALHTHLTLPIIWGMMLVGALGVALAALLITGVAAHPKIFKDAFRLRARQDAAVSRADWHNRLGVWTLPFALAVTMTGAFIGLSYAGAFLLGQVYTGGDIEPVYATIFGDEPPHDPAPAPLPNIARALDKVQSDFPQTFPTYVIVHDPMTRGQFVQVFAAHPRRLIYGEVYKFNGAGDYLGKVGIADGAIGQQAAGSVYNLHYGNYGGLPVELAYMLFGIALAAITATGITLWLRKRLRQGLPTRRLEAAWAVIVWGIPLLLLLAAWLRGLAGPDAPLTAGFWIALAGLLAVAAYRPQWFTTQRLRLALASLLAVTAAAHLAIFLPSQAGVLTMDAALFALAAILWRPRLPGLPSRRAASSARSGLQNDPGPRFSA